METVSTKVLHYTNVRSALQVYNCRITLFTYNHSISICDEFSISRPVNLGFLIFRRRSFLLLNVAMSALMAGEQILEAAMAQQEQEERGPPGRVVRSGASYRSRMWWLPLRHRPRPPPSPPPSSCCFAADTTVIYRTYGPTLETSASPAVPLEGHQQSKGRTPLPYGTPAGRPSGSGGGRVRRRKTKKPRPSTGPAHFDNVWVNQAP